MSRVRLGTFGIIHTAAYAAPGFFVINSDMSAAEHRRTQVHLIGPRRGYIRSIGDPSPRVSSHPIEGRRALARGGTSGAWSAPQNEMRFTQFDLQGRVVSAFSAKQDWFRPWTQWVSPTDGPPPPRVWSIAEDDKARLWVMIYVADAEYAPMPSPAIRRPLMRTHPHYDTIVEVYDVQSGNVLSRCRSGAMLGGFIQGPVIAEPDVDSRNAQVLRLFRLSLDD